MESPLLWIRCGYHKPSGFFISCKGLCTQIVQLNLEFQFTATTIMSMATKSRDSEDWTFGANLQTEGHIPKLLEGQTDPEEMGALGSAPFHSPSWSLASCPSTRHCLGIHMILTEKTGAVAPPSHTWMAPLVEDMLCHSREGLTKALVMGPGKAVLFYVRQSLGESLSLGEVRGATITLTGMGTWVGKPAYLAADSLTIQEG